MIEGVKSNQIDEFWPKVFPYIEKACEYSDGKYMAHDVYEALLKSDMQLWLAISDGISGAGVTQICDYPSKRICTVLFYSGTAIDYELLSTVERWAKFNKCESVEIWGRKGWERALNDYKEIHRCIRKPL